MFKFSETVGKCDVFCQKHVRGVIWLEADLGNMFKDVLMYLDLL